MNSTNRFYWRLRRKKMLEGRRRARGRRYWEDDEESLENENQGSGDTSGGDESNQDHGFDLNSVESGDNPNPGVPNIPAPPVAIPQGYGYPYGYPAPMYNPAVPMMGTPNAGLYMPQPVNPNIVAQTEEEAQVLEAFRKWKKSKTRNSVKESSSSKFRILLEKRRRERMAERRRRYLEGDEKELTDEELKELEKLLMTERVKNRFSGPMTVTVRKRYREDDGSEIEINSDDADFEGEGTSKGLTINVDFPPGYEAPPAEEVRTDVEPLDDENEGGEDELIERIRRRSKLRRERLARIRARRYREEDTPAGKDNEGINKYIGDLYNDIGSRPENVSERLERIRRLRRDRLRSLESKDVEIYDDGVIGDGEPAKKYQLENPENLPEYVKKRMGEKLDWDKLLKRGILG